MLQKQTVGTLQCAPQRKQSRYGLIALGVGVFGILAFVGWPYLSIAANVVELRLRGPKTVEDRLREFGYPVQQRLAPDFARAGVSYPPSRVALLGFKQERRVDVYAASATGAFQFIRSYPILAASGDLGPKLREGDAQVPEGLYRINFLNPNSRFHLSLRVNYPNDFDCAQAKADGRRQLGGDIMIHGNQVSAGCLAMGDQAAEDLFVLTATAGIDRVAVVISPIDFRVRHFKALPFKAPAWTATLYAQLQHVLRDYPIGLDRKVAPAATGTVKGGKGA